MLHILNGKGVQMHGQINRWIDIIEVTAEQECRIIALKMISENSVCHSIFGKCASRTFQKLLFALTSTTARCKPSCVYQNFFKTMSSVFTSNPPHDSTTVSRYTAALIAAHTQYLMYSLTRLSTSACCIHERMYICAST